MVGGEEMIIGLHTCNRLDFTKETVESLIRHNPDVLDYHWVVVDDNSDQDTLDYLDDLDKRVTMDSMLIKDYRAGITVGMKMMMEHAYEYHEGNILYLQNDWVTTRRIDFEAIDDFMCRHQVGHIRTIVDKGDYGRTCHRFASKRNLATGEPLKWERAHIVGDETVWSGNFHYSDIPGFINIDIAVRMFEPVDVIKVDPGEGIRVYNIERMGCKNYLLMNQPFWNLDWSKKHQTPGGRKK